jgi:hypothetical protein
MGESQKIQLIFPKSFFLVLRSSRPPTVELFLVFRDSAKADGG